jgi:hypothetical protein
MRALFLPRHTSRNTYVSDSDDGRNTLDSPGFTAENIRRRFPPVQKYIRGEPEKKAVHVRRTRAFGLHTQSML